ncbi:MAG: bifunctional helix-turn-helix transcriptional regulator/GNAT family N-acetyltransferase, partial [Acidobacteriia bacterium]|nr:bifunctional helix-turn-helix transcriptional regulator/GNAT family N-acetyltransferase [Terriglobia bacterium]
MDGFVDAVRAFNRFYTRQIGLLGKAYLASSFSLTEVRVLYELAHRDRLSATDLARDLDLDAGYLSRILVGFEKRGLIGRRVSKEDGRQSHVHLTAKGRKSIGPLETRAGKQIEAMAAHLTDQDRANVVNAMRTIEQSLGGAPESPYVLRPHRPGDMGWVIHRHGALYWREYGYDESFEALVAEIAAKFIRNFDARRERCWIAERDGVMLGSVFLVKQSEDVAKLRLLLVEPAARGLGLGKRLVEECVRFAREARYKKIVLWTQRELTAARAIYAKAGFRCVAEEPNPAFGTDSVA